MTAAKRRIDAAPLLETVRDYCRRTGTRTDDLGKLALNHPGYVALMRSRGTTSPEVTERLQSVMAEYPDGITKETIAHDRAVNVRRPVSSYKRDAELSALAERRERMDAMPRVSRDPCARCGVRGDIGCEHAPVRFGTSYG